jgi:hypothetical protein
MELMTTATLPVRMAQKTHKTEHHVMGLIQTFVKKVRKAAQVVHSCVQTIQAIIWRYVTILTTIAILLQSTVLERSGMELPVMAQIQTSVTRGCGLVRAEARPAQTQQAIQ